MARAAARARRVRRAGHDRSCEWLDLYRGRAGGRLGRGLAHACRRRHDQHAAGDNGDVRLALGSRELPLRLAVYDTADDEAAAQRARERERELLARDPEDVAAVPAGATAREPVATLALASTTIEPNIASTPASLFGIERRIA